MNTVARRTLTIYRHADEYVREKTQSAPISCKKGCSACCSQLTATDLAAAITIAVKIRSSSFWKDRLPELREQLRLAMVDTASVNLFDVIKDDSNNVRLDYFNLRRPCVLLDQATNTCTVYDSRPPACRYYMVISDPKLCGYENLTEPVASPSVGLQVQNQLLMDHANMLADQNLPMIVGSLQSMVMMALDYLDRGEIAFSDAKYRRPDVRMMVPKHPVPNGDERHE